MNPIDVLIITALQEEYDTAYEVARATHAQGYGIAVWEDRDVHTPTPYVFGTYVVPDGSSMNVALARPTRMGSTATGPVASSLVERLKPRCLAMCGVCAGNPADVALGDVIIAEMVYAYDEGKQAPEGFEGDHRQYAMSDTWVRAAQEITPRGLPSFGAPSEEEAKNWLLERLHAGDNPRTHPARARYFPGDAWRNCIQAFDQEGLVRRNGQLLELTDKGRLFVEETLFYDTDGPERLPLEVKVGPIASGNVVVKDGLTWDKLKKWGVRSVLGLEMEAAAIGSVAHRLGVQHWLVVKGVMDHADPCKDDRYKLFAARASAEVLFKFLLKQLMNTSLRSEQLHPNPRTGISQGQAFPLMASPGKSELLAFAEPFIDLHPLPLASSSANSPAIQHYLPELIADLTRHRNERQSSEAGYAIRSLHPPIILQYTNRSSVESKLIQALMHCSASGRGVISLEGMGGSGKTTLAAQLVGLDSTATLFSSGTFWLTVGRDRIGERLSSYICDVVKALTGNHFAANDLAVASAALIEVLSSSAKPVLLVLDDVWMDEQVTYLLRGGANVSRLIISRNKLGVLQNAHKIELSMMSRDEAIETLFIDISSDIRHSLSRDLLDALVSFSHRWPVLIAVLNAALKENIRIGASLVEVADWLIGLLRRSGPAALDKTLFVSVEKSVEATLGATLELINDEAKELFYSLCIFDEDVVIPDHLISTYWKHRYNIEQDEGDRTLGMFAHLRLIGVYWFGGRPGRILHDVLRDFIIHRCAADIRVAMSLDLIESWRSSFLPPNAQADWWRLPLSESFIFEHLSTQLIRAGLAEERQVLLHNLRWYIAQIMSLGSAVSAIADLEETGVSTLLALELFFSQNAMIFRREASTGGLASTLLAYASNNAELCSLVRESDGALECPLVRSILPLASPTHNLVEGHLAPIGDVAVSPDGCLIATVSDDTMALLLDAKTGAIRKRLIGHTERARSCSFSPSGRHLLTSGMDGTARVWDVATGNTLAVVGREGYGLLGSCWSPSGTLIAGAFADGVTVVWHAQDGEVVASFKTEHEGKGTWALCVNIK